MSIEHCVHCAAPFPLYRKEYIHRLVRFFLERFPLNRSLSNQHAIVWPQLLPNNQIMQKNTSTGSMPSPAGSTSFPSSFRQSLSTSTISTAGSSIPQPELIYLKYSTWSDTFVDCRATWEYSPSAPADVSSLSLFPTQNFTKCVFSKLFEPNFPIFKAQTGKSHRNDEIVEMVRRGSFDRAAAMLVVCCAPRAPGTDRPRVVRNNNISRRRKIHHLIF